MSPEQDLLAQAFGGNTVDLYGTAELLAQMKRNQDAAAPQDQPTQPDILGAVAARAGAEVVGTSWELAQQVHATTTRLFGEMLPPENQLRVPELSELTQAGVDFEQLRSGYESLEAAGLGPELVIAPVDLPMDSWESVFSHLRQWQEGAHPPPAQGQADPLAGRRLKNQTDGDGLWISPVVKPHWDSLNEQAVSNTPGHNAVIGGVTWKVLVVPSGNLATSTSHNLATSNIEAQAQAAGLTDPTPKNVHMPIGAYLTVQANHFLEEKEPLDKSTWTWDNGTFMQPGGIQHGQQQPDVPQAPASYWYPDYGQVDVNDFDPGGAGGIIGARVPVWG